jgi:hypothetical protein
MWGLLFQIFFFAILIWIGHMGYNYIRDSNTHKKTKDLVNTQVEKYKQLLDESILSQKKDSQHQMVITEEDQIQMEKELEAFLEKHLTEGNQRQEKRETEGN